MHVLPDLAGPDLVGGIVSQLTRAFAWSSEMGPSGTATWRPFFGLLGKCTHAHRSRAGKVYLRSLTSAFECRFPAVSAQVSVKRVCKWGGENVQYILGV